MGLVFYSGGGNAVFFGAGIAGIPAIFIGLALGFIIYLILSWLKPYNADSVGHVFREIFEDKKKSARVPNTDLFIIGGGIVLLLIAILIKANTKTIKAWPPLSGFGGILTDVVFYILAAGLTLISLYILVRTIAWAKNLKK